MEPSPAKAKPQGRLLVSTPLDAKDELEEQLVMCVGIIQSLTNGLSEREANDALTANMFHSKDASPYSRVATLKVLCLAAKETTKVFSWRMEMGKVIAAEKEELKEYALWDGEDVLKASSPPDVCLVKDQVYILSKFKRTYKRIVLTKDTKVYSSSNLSVPEADHKRGQQMLFPPSEEVPLSTFNDKSNSNKLISASGRVISVSTVILTKDQVPLREVTLSSDTGHKANLALWREAAMLPITLDQSITVTHLLVKDFQKFGMKGCSTSFTTIGENSSKMMRELEADGLAQNGESLLLITRDGDEVEVPEGLWSGSVPQLCTFLPFKVQVSVEGATVVKIEGLPKTDPCDEM